LVVALNWNYWMTLIVPPTVNGCGGATPAMSCQIVPGSSVANARVPVDPTDRGVAEA
jgi:hypothetical protein